MQHSDRIVANHETFVTADGTTVELSSVGGFDGRKVTQLYTMKRRNLTEDGAHIISCECEFDPDAEVPFTAWILYTRETLQCPTAQQPPCQLRQQKTA